MFKQALTYVILVAFWVASGFTYEKGEKWKAVLELEGKGKKIFLVSNSIYGGYNSLEKKYFFFGKNHMFRDQTNPDFSQIFSDFCVTNASGQFEFEVNNVKDPGLDQTSESNISFKKKTPGKSSLKNLSDGTKEITYSGNFKNLGLTLTEEAKKIMTGDFTLTIKSEK